MCWSLSLSCFIRSTFRWQEPCKVVFFFFFFFLSSDSEDEVEERCSVVDSDNESEHVGSEKTSRGEFM